MPQEILVIDDDLFIREIYITTLKKAGYDVDFAIDGEEGLKKLQIGGYSLVLLDMMMPKLNGSEVLKSLSQNPPKIPNGPIILLSNSGKDTLVEEGLRNGATTYFVKADLTPDQLLSEVKKLLN